MCFAAASTIEPRCFTSMSIERPTKVASLAIARDSGFTGTIDLLGEDSQTVDDCEKTVDAYLAVIDEDLARRAVVGDHAAGAGEPGHALVVVAVEPLPAREH